MIKKMVLAFIWFYQKVSAVFPPRCRFYPTCSQYMQESINKYGLFRGVIMGGRRIARCHPFNEGGHDPVPANENISHGTIKCKGKE